MPRYRMRLDVPESTAQSASVSTSIEVDELVIEEGLLFVPPGSRDFVSAELRYGDRRLLPTSNSTPVLLANVPERGPINVQLPGVPTDIELRAWAPDTTEQHTVTAAFNAVPVENAAQAVRLVGGELTASVVSGPDTPPAEGLTQSDEDG